jgi:hypothetical protein
MNNLFLALLLLSFLGLVVGLINPSWARIQSRKRVGMIFGGALVAFFILFGITIPSTPSTESVTQAAPVQAPSVPLVAVSSSSEVNDATYVSYWNVCVNNNAIDDFFKQMSNLTNDALSQDYIVAVQDGQNAQADISYAQTTCLPQLENYKPLTPDIAQANTLTINSIAEISADLKPIMVDMQSGDNGTKFNSDLAAWGNAASEYGQAKKLINAWQSANPQ